MANKIGAAIAANPGILDKPGNEAFSSGQDLGALVQSDSSFLITASPELANPIKQAFAESTAGVFVSATVVVLAAFIVSLFIKELALRTKSGVQEKAEQAAAGMQ
jgi:hypothetical protein